MAPETSLTYPNCYFILGIDYRRRGFSPEFAAKAAPTDCYPTEFPGGNSEREPPDPIPNSEVKTLSADGSVGSPHVRVGHRQDLI